MGSRMSGCSVLVVHTCGRRITNLHKDCVALAHWTSLRQSFININSSKKVAVATCNYCYNAKLHGFSSTFMSYVCSRMPSVCLQSEIRYAISFEHFFAPYKDDNMSDEGAITMRHNPLFVCAINISFLNSSPSSLMDERTADLHVQCNSIYWGMSQFD